jgi:LytR cell envelope-related transcriptional attenuator
MTNRREEEFAYSGPSRSGVFWAAGLVLLALIIAVVVLQKVDSNKKTSVAGNSLTPSESTVAQTDSSTPAVIGDPNVPTTIAPAAARLPGAVRVIVTNGSGVNKAARRVNEVLVPSGYQMVSPRDANAKNLADAVFFKPGFEPEAKAIAASLGVTYVGGLPATPTIKTPPAAPEFDVQVMVGPELAKKYKPGSTTPAAADPAAAAPAPAPAEATSSSTTTKP